MIDWNLFNVYLGNIENDKVLEMVDSFIGSFPREIEILKHAVAAKDYVSVDNAAHDLKANCYWFGATVAGQLVLQLEMMGKKLQEDKMDDVFPKVEAALNEVISELREYRTTLII
jgi:HPt (histidine-containing phosphotransfer) domain-containing protein